MSTPCTRLERLAHLQQALRERILLLDGAMGTMIQGYELSEEHFRGERFTRAEAPKDLRGNNDLLTLTQPHVIKQIHTAYLVAGADILETNTFNSTTHSQEDYDLAHLAHELNVAGARLAREACDEATAQDGKPRFVAGVLGPTSKTCSISPDVNDPGFRNITYDALYEAYTEATDGLVQGGADIIMVETIFDTLNAKAALHAVMDYLDVKGLNHPIMISGTITDASGRTLTGQVTEAFWYSVRHAQPISVGLNCALGAKDLRPYIAELARVAECYVSAHPNAGLPNAFGGYDETPADMAAVIGEFAQSGLLNIVGGCCGTSPAFIAAMKDVVAGVTPRAV